MVLHHFKVLVIVFLMTPMSEGNNDHQSYSLSSPLLSGKQLKVAIAELGASSQIYRNATGHVTGYGGVFYEELSWISLRLNFSLDMVPSKDNVLGDNLQNVSIYTGMLGQLQREEVDLACAPVSGAAGTLEILELAVYVVGDSFGIFVKYPVPQIKIDGPIRTFSLYVWVGLLISIIACIGCTQFLNYLARKYLVIQSQLYNTITLSNTWMYIIGTLTNHSVNDPRNRPRSVGIVAFIWLLATFVFVNIYSSCMASYMSLRFQRPDVSTFQDLATNSHYQPITIKGSSAELLFLTATSGTMKKIGDKLRECTFDDGGCIRSKLEPIIQNVLKSDFVGILPTTLGQYYIRKTMSNRKCHLTMGQDTMAFRNFFLGVPKKSPYTMELKKESFWWNSFGLQSYWMNKMLPVPRQCLLQYNNKGESVQLVDRARLKLEQFTVAFVVLFIGYVLALLQFIRERFILKGRN